MRKLICTICAACSLFTAVSAQAVFLDPYDNALFPDGFYGSAYQNVVVAGKRNDSHGNKVGDADFSSYVTTVRGSYYKTLAGIPVIFQAGIPFGHVEEKKLVREKSSGLGDIWFGPGVFLYKDAQSQTYLSYWFYGYAPTGKFDGKNAYANMGWNHWYFENQLAFSQALGKFILDANVNHFFHTKEQTNKVETPDRLEFETSLGYQITGKLLAGLNFEGHWDLGDYKVAGVTLPDSGAQRYEVGPVLGYTFNDKLGATLRWNHDFAAKNDFMGDSFWLRLSYSF